MKTEFSTQNEQFLANIVAVELFPSKEAALDGAIEALRETTQQAAAIPDEHIELIEQGIASLQAGRCRAFTDADWENLRQLARNTPPGSQSGGLDASGDLFIEGRTGSAPDHRVYRAR
jgi:hypothetical protein